MGRAAHITGLFCVVLAVVTPKAHALRIEGTIRLSKPRAEAQQPQATGYWKAANGVLPTRRHHPNATKAVAVVLKSKTEAKTGAITLRLRGGALEPAIVCASPETKLKINNTDILTHRLFAKGIAEWAPLETAPGNVRQITVPSNGGPWTIKDKLYSHITGYLHSIPNVVAQASPDSRGSFTFPDAKPGKYELLVIREDKIVARRDLTIRGKRTLDLGEINVDKQP